MTKKVLLLGSGFVAKPTVDILAETSDVEVTVACRTLNKAKEMAGTNAEAISLDATDEDALESEIAKFDLVISLIPYVYHVNVVKAAIKTRKHVVTTSYISPKLKVLEKQIEDAGIIVMNEIGLDPGIDHLYAVKTIEEVHQQAGQIKSFHSYCGGVPAPESSDNPLGLKFSWSPRGVILALRNTARYWQNGEIQQVEFKDLMATAEPYLIYPGFAFVAYPNRDSTAYKDLYNIPEAETVIRGNLRFQGFPEFIQVLIDIGILTDNGSEAFTKPIPWKEAISILVGAQNSDESAVISRIESLTTFANEQDKARTLSGLRWLGLFSDTPITARGNPLDTFCETLEELMQYKEGERDMVCLQHKFGIQWADGSKETRTSTLVEYGDVKGYSAMAKLVGTPCAVAAQQILDETISKPGLLAPMSSEINDPLRETLRDKYGISLAEKTINF